MRRLITKTKFSQKQLGIIIAALVSFGLLLVLLINAAAANPSIYLNPDSTLVDPGAEFSVDVLVDTQGRPVSYVKAAYSYPSNLLDLVSIDYTNTQFPLDLQSTSSDGSIVISRGPNLGTAPVSGNGLLLAKLNFRAKDTASGTAGITFDTGSSVLIDNDTVANLLPGLGGFVVHNYITFNSVTPPPPTVEKVAILSLSPSTQSVKNGDTFNVAVRVNSQSELINNVGIKLNYPSNLADFVSATSAGSPFTLVPNPASASGGVVTIDQSIGAGASAVNGDQLVTTLTFRAKLDATGSSNLTFGLGSAVYRSSDGADVFKDSVGAAVAFEGAPPPPPPPPPPTAPVAVLFIQPATQSVEGSSNFNLSVRVNSYEEAINSVAVRILYPADEVDFISSSSSGSQFSLVPTPGVSSGGVVSVDQSINVGAQPTTGDQLVTTLTFKAKTSVSGTGGFNFTTGSAVYRASDSDNTLKEVINSVVAFSGLKAPVAPSVSPAPAPAPYSVPKYSPAPTLNYENRSSITSSTDSSDTTPLEFKNVAGEFVVVELIVLDENKKPISNAKVTIGSYTAISDQNGKAIFNNVKPGTYEVKVEGKKSIEPSRIKVDVVSSGASQNFTVATSTSAKNPASWTLILVSTLAVVIILGAVAYFTNRANSNLFGSVQSISKIGTKQSKSGSAKQTSKINSTNVNTKVYYPQKKRNGK